MSGRGDADLAGLLARAAAGEQAAFDALVDRFAGLVWRIALNHRLRSADAADVSQTVWLRLVEQFDRIREPERLGAWLATTTRHECLAVLRKGARAVPAEEATFEVSMPLGVLGAPLAGPEASDRLEADERRAALREAFADLDERCRLLLALLHTDPPATYEEITVAMEMPVGSIGPTRQRCLGKLRGHPAMARISGDADGSEGGEVLR
jgi:RNA polymerase sigma factor (sigma-70 family)